MDSIFKDDVKYKLLESKLSEFEGKMTKLNFNSKSFNDKYVNCISFIYDTYKYIFNLKKFNFNNSLLKVLRTDMEFVFFVYDFLSKCGLNPILIKIYNGFDLYRGDILFMKWKTNKSINHAGVLLENKEVIHAVPLGKVSKNNLSTLKDKIIFVIRVIE